MQGHPGLQAGLLERLPSKTKSCRGDDSVGKSLPPVRLQFNPSEHSTVVSGQKDWEQGRRTLTPVWGCQSQVGDMFPFDATPHHNRRALGAVFSVHMEQGSGTACPLRLHQCLLFLGREHSRPRLNIARYRAMSLGTRPVVQRAQEDVRRIDGHSRCG